MELGRFLIETHLRTGRPIAELAAAHGVHRSWLYKLLARYREQGDVGLVPGSRRPHNSEPTKAIAQVVGCGNAGIPPKRGGIPYEEG